jgi:cell fate regulator YaaT (PSP1 superfamily)
MKIEDCHIPNFVARGLCVQQKDNISDIKFSPGCCKLPAETAFGGIKNMGNALQFDCVEVRFKNNHKDFFRLNSGLNVELNDIVAVEASPGHDIGIISLVGPEVMRQMKRKKASYDDTQMKKVYRKAKPADIEKWYQAIEREYSTMRRTIAIIRELNLNMKLNDVEFQGDNTKAIFYYTAEDRVDFRELIKIMADEFKIRIEMRQIGARQESGKLGGIGSCGRELCCSTFIHQFQSVTTNAARVQQLSLNPQKLAGICGKLKCCLNYETPVYVEILKTFPDQNVALKTKQGLATHVKSDIFKKLMWYSYTNSPGSLMALTIENVEKVQKMNKNNQIPDNLEDFAISLENKVEDDGVVGKDDISKLAD